MRLLSLSEEIQLRVIELEEEREKMRQEKDERDSLFQDLVQSLREFDSLFVNGSPKRAQTSDKLILNSEMICEMRKRSAEVASVLRENTSLKNELSSLVQENLSLKNAAKDRPEKNKSSQVESLLREELKDEKERVSSLMDELDAMKERLRCSEVVCNELKKQVKELSASSSSPNLSAVASAALTAGQQQQQQQQPTAVSYANNVHNNSHVLRQELKSVREVIAAREAVIKSLNDKYMRHRQVWEENERRANEEIKKLDEIIDRVVLTLSDCSPIITDCPPLKRLFEDLTRDQQIAVVPNLSSTIV